MLVFDSIWADFMIPNRDWLGLAERWTTGMKICEEKRKLTKPLFSGSQNES